MKLGLLVLTTGKQEGKLLEIKLPQFLVGRDPQCHLRPASALISKRHCVLIQRDEKAFIRDFDSTNGTFVNDEPVKGERELNNGDHLKIGPIEFKVQLEAGAAPANRTPAPPTSRYHGQALPGVRGKVAEARGQVRRQHSRAGHQWHRRQGWLRRGRHRCHAAVPGRRRRRRRQ